MINAWANARVFTLMDQLADVFERDTVEALDPMQKAKRGARMLLERATEALEAGESYGHWAFSIWMRHCARDENGVPLAGRSIPIAPRLQVAALNKVSDVCGRLLALRYLLEQRGNMGEIEIVGRTFYTTKAAVALALGREGGGDDVCVAVWNMEESNTPAGRWTDWTELKVPEGFGGWRYSIVRESSG